MRLFPATLLCLTLTLSAASAAEISYEGAQKLEKQFTAPLPEDLVKRGIIKVRPGTDDYQVTFDPTVFLKDVDPKTFSITGLKPLLSLVRPLENGLWHFAQTDDLHLKGEFKAAEEKTSFGYDINSFSMDGVFDPDLLYFQSAVASAEGITLTSKSSQQSIDATFGSMKNTIDSKRGASGTIDIRSNSAMNAFSETITDKTKNVVVISGDTVIVDVAFNGLVYRPLQGLVSFALDKIHRKELTGEEQTQLKQLVRSNLPMFDALLESIEIANPKITTPQGEFGAQSFRYAIDMNGFRDDASIGFGFGFDKPTVPAGTIPEAFKVAVPDTVDMHISLKNIDIASGVTHILDKADFTAEKPLSDADMAAAGRIFLPDGALTINYDNVSAHSSVYDVSMSGTTTVYPEQQGRQNSEVTVYAREFDKTIAYLQQNAKTVPQFGQAAFMLLMVKGFAKTAPDGRQMWTIAIDENKKVKINGQDLPFQ